MSNVALLGLYLLWLSSCNCCQIYWCYLVSRLGHRWVLWSPSCLSPWWQRGELLEFHKVQIRLFGPVSCEIQRNAVFARFVYQGCIAMIGLGTGWGYPGMCTRRGCPGVYTKTGWQRGRWYSRQLVFWRCLDIEFCSAGFVVNWRFP